MMINFLVEEGNRGR